MAHNHLRASDLRKAQRVQCPDYQRASMMGKAKPLPFMVMLSDNVWRRAYSVLGTGQSYILVNGAEQVIGSHAQRRIQELMHKARGG
jgi:hypothetical protein